jgi:beta-lactamase regulating signal transducer with metallopeptidase domain
VDAERIATSILFILFNYLLASTVLLGVAWIVTSKLSERHDSLTELFWKAGLIASVVAPVSQAMVSAVGHPAGQFIPASMPAAAVHIEAYTIDARVSLGIVASWLIIALGGVTGLVRSHLNFRSKLATRRPLTAAERQVIGSMFQSVHAISVSSAIDVPIALGREICLPPQALSDLSRTELHAVLVHEAAHIKRGDTGWRWLSSIIARVMFFQPLNFVARTRLRELSECLCDDEAVARTRSASDLAAALASFASSVVNSRRHTLEPSLTSRESLTLRRVRRILAPSRPREAFRLSGKLPLRALVVILSAMLIAAPRIVPASDATIQYVVTATDPAGPFTLTVHRGRVVAATIDGRAVPANRFVQVGAKLHVFAGPSPFTIELKPGGGITWLPRPSAPTHL